MRVIKPLHDSAERDSDLIGLIIAKHLSIIICGYNNILFCKIKCKKHNCNYLSPFLAAKSLRILSKTVVLGNSLLAFFTSYVSTNIIIQS